MSFIGISIGLQLSSFSFDFLDLQFENLSRNIFDCGCLCWVIFYISRSRLENVIMTVINFIWLGLESTASKLPWACVELELDDEIFWICARQWRGFWLFGFLVLGQHISFDRAPSFISLGFWARLWGFVVCGNDFISVPRVVVIAFVIGSEWTPSALLWPHTHLIYGSWKFVGNFDKLLWFFLPISLLFFEGVLPCYFFVFTMFSFC